MKRHFLKPGELFYSKEKAIVKTVLGSCIAICIWDKRQKVGGINHYILPDNVQQGAKVDISNKYASNAIPNLLKAMKYTLGSRKEDLVIKVIGGAHVQELHSTIKSVGSYNANIAYEILEKFGFKVAVSAVGGNHGREVEFDTFTGELRYKNIKEHEQVQIKEQDKKIKVLIIDDSSTIRMLLKYIINKEPSIELVGEAADPYEAMEIRKKIKPDVITLDINMPKMDGITYLKQYMKTDPVPTILVTSHSLEESGPVLDGLENGAFDYIQKPSRDSLQQNASEIIERIKAAGSARIKSINDLSSINKTKFIGNEELSDYTNHKYLIAIGASTGGTETLKKLLMELPNKIPPILIVQHIPPIFSKAFADRLNELCPFTVKEAEDNDIISLNHVYIAPGGRHMKVNRQDSAYRIKITDDPHVNKFKPSVDYLFNSLVDGSIKDKKLIGVILTGMGYDGAKGLLNLHSMGAETIAQDEETSIVFGMPKEAIKLNAASYILPLGKIANKLVDIISLQNQTKFKKTG